MTRDEIIEKGEKQLQFTLDKLEKGGIPNSWIKGIAERGFHQLEMLFFILDEEYKKYDYWFDKFLKYM